ncbi:T9SS type B sorting domain-containing protein [Robertkochia sediminum]|uniref:T9SS type B sorting domain-containing protein n=1 Tax=Robertkochia sediminum TaxID=2785326 RepID=UPI001931EAEB|nr:gliding motility-associated C-terminal domain-containing protein [Robertkochia sediminum]MBL7473423.1 gliding motility-associated C-terminal domain-containing protein [Robertkochia sediminum]
MMNKNSLLTCCILLFALAWVNAQTLKQPQLRFSYACVSDSYSTFNVGFSFSEKSFESSNVFYIELSDAYGDFGSPRTLAEIGDKNNAFEFDVPLDLPKDLAGSGYRVRIRATAPAMVSPLSDPFEAYYVPQADLVLNNYEASSLCASSVTLLELNVDVAATYLWYKDGVVFAETDEPFLEVDVAGQYYVEPFYGACSGSNFSNIVTVEALDAFSVNLVSGTDVTVCDGAEVVLQGEPSDEMLSYQWFHDDVPVDGGHDITLRFTASAETYGNYTLEAINLFGCEARSQVVAVKPAEAIHINAISAAESVILGDAVAQLTVEVNTPGLEVVWYRDGNEVSRGIDMLSHQAAAPGAYYAEVTTEGGCVQTATSTVFHVYEPESFTMQVSTDSHYAPCEVAQAGIELAQLTGILSNGDLLDITPSLYESFEFRWLRDGTDTGASGPAYTVNDHTGSGAYVLELTYKGSVYTSETLDLFVGLPQAEIIQESVLTCDEPALLTTTALEDVIYNWYLDGAMVASGLEAEYDADLPGTYTLEMEYMGCVKEVPGVVVTSEAASLVHIYPGDRIALVPGADVQLIADGADSYLWKDASGQILGETDRVTVSDEGTYTLHATKGSCEVEKLVEVYYDLASAIPNVVTPNSDNVNDHWVLPQKLLDDPSLEVIICDSYGNPVLQTNNYDNSWPASASRSVLREPNYYYILNRGGKSIQKGVITLVR